MTKISVLGGNTTDGTSGLNASMVKSLQPVEVYIISDLDSRGH